MADKPTLLLVDDEERILRSLSLLLRPQYKVHATTDPHEALAIVGREPVHVVVSDQKMPLMRGAELLREIKARSPNSMRILLTGYAELDAVVSSVNEGEIFRYVSKPWDAAELRATVGQAADIALPMFAQAAAASVPVPVEAPATSVGVLVVDDDPAVFTAVREIVGAAQPVYAASSLDEVFQQLERYDIGVLIAELLVRGENLTAVLKLLKAQHPELVTIVMTPFDDTGTLISLINQGQIYRLLPKPVRRGPLGMNIASALRHHRQLKASPLLRARHRVEQIRRPDELGLAERVRGFLGRLRARTAPG